MWEKFSYLIGRLRERLWFKPLLFCGLSIATLFCASLLDRTGVGQFLPQVSQESTETLLKVMASSMLVMATFAVGSMVSAYASASNSATPRSFPLIIADDTSQNAMSAFIGAFIYSIVAIAASANGNFGGKASQFGLFALTIAVFAIVVLFFIWWVDSIARLGRMGHTIGKVEAAAEAAIRKRFAAAGLGKLAVSGPPIGGQVVFGTSIGYLQRIHTTAIQERATKSELKVVVAALPGTFCTPTRPLAWIVAEGSEPVSDEDIKVISAAFIIGDSRMFDQDPRFGLIVLSEIASRALSPAVNDPGTAIDVTHKLFRLLVTWHECAQRQDEHEQQDKNAESVQCDRIAVLDLSMADLFDDAFAAIARDGAGTVEVVVRLLKVLEALAALDDPLMRAAAIDQAQLTVARAEQQLTLQHDLCTVKEVSTFAR